MRVSVLTLAVPSVETLLNRRHIQMRIITIQMSQTLTGWREFVGNIVDLMLVAILASDDFCDTASAAAMLT